MDDPQELQSLRDENARLRRELASARKMQGSLAARSVRRGSLISIVGLEERVVQLSKSGEVEYVNTAMARFLNAPRESLLQQSLTTLETHCPWPPGVLAEIVGLANDETPEHILECGFTDAKTGKDAFVVIKANRVSDGRCQIVISDVTDFKVIESTFRRMVAPQVVERVMALGDDFMACERRELSVLFADLRGFTSLSQTLEPEEIRETINSWLSDMTQVIVEAEATVDKYVGDEIMALFGAPEPMPDHAITAVKVGLDMQTAHRAWCARQVKLDRPSIQMAIGINTGEMVIGNIGSKLRTDYTVLGHHVNLAARLCSSAKAGDVYLGPATFAAIKNAAESDLLPFAETVKFRAVGRIEAKGIAEPVEVVNATMEL